MPPVTSPIDVSTHHLGQFKALNTCTQDQTEHWGQALSMQFVSQMCPTVQRWGRSHVFESSVVINFLWFLSSLPTSVIIFRLKRLLVDCLPGCQTHACPNDQIRGSPPSHSFISLPCFNQHFFCSSFRHTFHQFCSNVPFQRQNTKRDGFSGWWGDSGGEGSFSQKYQWLYNSITGLAERVRRERKGNTLPGVAPFSPSFLPQTPALYYQRWIKVSLTLRMSSLKQPARDPHPSRSSCLILLSDLLCDLLWTMGGSFSLDIPAQQLYAPSLPYRELSST